MAFTKIDDLIDGTKAMTVGISGHERPDADCIGSSLALWQYLTKRYPQLRVDVFLEEVPQVYRFLRGSDVVRTDYRTDVGRYDIFIAVDTEKGRTGEAEKYFDAASLRVNVDHHVSNHGSGDENYLEPEASSCCELIYLLLDREYLDRDIAETLYCGIIGDTGVFKYSSTSPRTLRVAAELISYGFDFNDLIDRTFYRRTYVQNRLLGRVLVDSTLLMDGRCIVGVLTRETMRAYQGITSDLEGIANQLMLTTGVACAIFLHETDNMVFKASLRSSGLVDVSRVASVFGGGGHVRAAGCILNGTCHDCVNNLAKYVAEQLQGV